MKQPKYCNAILLKKPDFMLVHYKKDTSKNRNSKRTAEQNMQNYCKIAKYLSCKIDVWPI